MNYLKAWAIVCVLVAGPATAEEALPDIVVADFEGETYGEWKAEGEAFGTGPANAALPGQMKVSGFKGKGLVNSFLKGDHATGTLTSPQFTIERPWLNFLIGGGGHAGKTCMNLLVDGKVVRTATGPNDRAGGSESLEPASWDVAEFVGKTAVIQIVDRHTKGWGHINVDQIVLSARPGAPVLVDLTKTLTVTNTHLIVPVDNQGEQIRIGVFVGDRLVQSFDVSLPTGDNPYWLAAYPLSHFGLDGKEIRIAQADGKKISDVYEAGFDLIRIGTAENVLADDDYDQPYRDQFHVTTRRGWNNDPNGMVYHDGQYHLFYQYNPFGIKWGNMHWGHFVSTDLIHWDERPIALFQKTRRDMMFSGGGFVDFNNSAGVGKDTLFVAFTSTGRGECLAYTKDGGLTFTELPENPVIKHRGRDPKVIWYEPEKKWVLVVFNNEPCAETEATPSRGPEIHKHANMAFYESKDLRQWNRTGAFTDPDRRAVFECPELFELPVEGKPDESRWILYGAQNRYFIGHFNGRTFVKESGPHGGSRGSLYAAQTFSDTPDGRRIQIGWIRTRPADKYPNQIVSQSFSLPQQFTLRTTKNGLRVFIEPVKEVESLRGELLSDSPDGLKACEGGLCEVLIEFKEVGKHELILDGTKFSFEGKKARIFVDRTLCEGYIDDGAEYLATNRASANFGHSESAVINNSQVASLKVYRMKSIWKKN